MRKTKILIVIIAVILLGLTVLVDSYYDLIKSFYYSCVYTNDEIDGMIQKHYDEIDNYLSENEKYKVRQSTDVEDKLHGQKVITDDELMDLITEKLDIKDMFGFELELNKKEEIVKSDGTVVSNDELISAKEDIASKKDNPSESDNKDSDNNSSQAANDKASECIAKMYVLKSTFESQLDGIYAEAKAQYISIPKDKRKNSRSEVLKNFYGRATALESSCDAEVNKVLAELESALKSAGESTELVAKIRNAYNEEKSLKKAYYINLYNS